MFVDLVNQYFANLRKVTDHTESLVNSTHFTFDAKEINELFGMTNQENDFCTPKSQSPIINYDNLRNSFFGNPHGTSLTNYKMNYFTTSNCVLYHIVVSVL